MTNRILPEFQNFLLSRSLVPAKNAPFYTHWVSKFFVFSNRNQELRSDLKFQKFLKYLKLHKKIADRQVKQAAGLLATHPLIDGVNITEIQDLPGHKHGETTMIYTRVLRDVVSVPRRPLDSLYVNRSHIADSEPS